MKVKAKKINNPHCDYLTEGRVYHVCWTRMGDMFIRDDDFRRIRTFFKNCKHINGDWTIITEPARVR